MFQQALDLSEVSSRRLITSEPSKKAQPGDSRILAKGLNSKRLSNFSDVSEILDGPGLLTGRFGKRKQCERERVTIRLLASKARCQNLNEMPPRTERRVLPTNVNTSAFSELGCTSSRLRASTIASARKGNPNVGNSCVTWILNEGS